jgi:hypothetical protein
MLGSRLMASPQASFKRKPGRQYDQATSVYRDLIRRALGRQHGRTVKEGRASDLAGDEYIRQVYLGV